MLTLRIDARKSAGDFKKEFNYAFPYLKIELFKNVGVQANRSIKTTTTLSSNQIIGKESTVVDFDGSISVSDLKGMLMDKLGLVSQIYRKSGSMWIETSLTDDWSLDKQNHEAELMNQGSI